MTPPADRLADRRAPVVPVAVDCRWIGLWGAGRVMEMLVRGLQSDPPERPWALWGSPAKLAPLAWPGAVVVAAEDDPRDRLGQRAWFRVPEAGVVLFGHQRPLRRLPAVTWLFDTIQLRYGGSAAERRARRLYLRRLTAISDTVLTISEHSRRSIEVDLGVAADRIEVVSLPVDWARADRIRARRATSDPPFALYLGRFAPHKNLDRLVEAFSRTAFATGGGRLVLVGGIPAETAALERSLTPAQRRSVEVRGRDDDRTVEALMAGASLVVQPSLEEGFGLPVAEALAAGVPVCVSDGGALPEMVGDLAVPFPATSTEAMAAAIDATVAAAEDGGPDGAARRAEAARRRFPAVGGFARHVRHVLERHVPDRNATGG